jgi:hypothetical protein
MQKTGDWEEVKTVENPPLTALATKQDVSCAPLS